MAIFQDVTLGFKGAEYIVKHNKVMKLIAIVEDVVTLKDLTSGKGPKLNKLAEAYSVALNYAGAKTEVDDVYASLFGDGGGEMVSGSITALIMLMLPPDSYNAPAEASGK